MACVLLFMHRVILNWQTFANTTYISLFPLWLLWRSEVLLTPARCHGSRTSVVRLPQKQTVLRNIPSTKTQNKNYVLHSVVTKFRLVLYVFHCKYILIRPCHNSQTQIWHTSSEKIKDVTSPNLSSRGLECSCSYFATIFYLYSSPHEPTAMPHKVSAFIGGHVSDYFLAPGAGTSWSSVVTVRLPGNNQKLQEVPAHCQEI